MEDVEKAENSPQSEAKSTDNDNHGTSNNDHVMVVTGGSGSVDVQVAVNEQPIEPAPPTYGLMSKVKTARQEAGDDWKAFLFQFIIILFSSVYAAIFLAITIVIPIAMIAIGSIYVRDCPRERYIPIYLIVGGSFAIVSQLMRIFRQLLGSKDEDNNARPHPLEGILSCFLFAWFIAGNVWVYRIHGDYSTENPLASDYCHPTVYLFSFWLITATYILVAAGCCGVCLGGICLAMVCRSVAS